MAATKNLDGITFLDEAPPELGRPTSSRYDALREALKVPGESGAYRWAKVATFAEGERINAQQRAGSMRNGRGSWSLNSGAWEVRLTAGEVADGEPVKGSGLALWVRYVPQSQVPAPAEDTNGAQAPAGPKPKRGRRANSPVEPAAEQATA